ncbi:MAG: SOS response-associated peptidase [Halodesulfurarchaeum sp.]
MCGRTSLFTPQPDIEQRFGAAAESPIRPRYNIAPGDDLVTVHGASPDTLTFDEWGFVPRWMDEFEESYRPINARAETVDDKPLFRDAFGDRHCLVVADGFYEWQGDRGGKQPYRVALEDDDLFAMAGIWDTWKGNGDTRTTVAIITTDANDDIEAIHDRMPVVLEPENESAWLHPSSADAAKSLLGPYDGEDLYTYPISPIVNDPSNDSPAVLDPIGGPSGQTGLGDFGAD